MVGPFVAPGPSGVAVRGRLKHLTAEDERVLRLVGAHLGALASRDLKARCADGLEHSADAWAVRKRGLTPLSSSRWAGALTKASHDQWALARRCQAAHVHGLEAGIRAIRHRLSLPVRERGSKRAPGGYRSAREWYAKSRRLAVLEARHAAAVADWQAGRVRVVRGGKRLANSRHHLADARDLLDRAATATRADDAEAITDINTRFHDRILAMAGNSLLISVMEPVDGRLRWLTRRNEEWPQLLTDHHELYESIASGDPERARAHALAHVQANYRSTVRHLFGETEAPRA
ncbi:FCD domain-containing protein [Streptomyces mirabilis]|uniref:FCD domain-containing protein n=1 Tax=Streptomyces mirabilis TaxID=68239 RepID=UPI003668CE41